MRQTISKVLRNKATSETKTYHVPPKVVVNLGGNIVLMFLEAARPANIKINTIGNRLARGSADTRQELRNLTQRPPEARNHENRCPEAGFPVCPRRPARELKSDRGAARRRNGQNECPEAGFSLCPRKPARNENLEAGTRQSTASGKTLL